MPPKLTPQMKDEIVSKVQLGMNHQQLAEEYKISQTTISHLSKDKNIEMRCLYKKIQSILQTTEGITDLHPQLNAYQKSIVPHGLNVILNRLNEVKSQLDV